MNIPYADGSLLVQALEVLQSTTDYKSQRRNNLEQPTWGVSQVCSCKHFSVMNWSFPRKILKEHFYEGIPNWPSIQRNSILMFR